MWYDLLGEPQPSKSSHFGNVLGMHGRRSVDAELMNSDHPLCLSKRFVTDSITRFSSDKRFAIELDKIMGIVCKFAIPRSPAMVLQCLQNDKDLASIEEVSKSLAMLTTKPSNTFQEANRESLAMCATFLESIGDGVGKGVMQEAAELYSLSDVAKLLHQCLGADEKDKCFAELSAVLSDRSAYQPKLVTMKYSTSLARFMSSSESAMVLKAPELVHALVKRLHAVDGKFVSLFSEHAANVADFLPTLTQPPFHDLFSFFKDTGNEPHMFYSTNTEVGLIRGGCFVAVKRLSKAVTADIFDLMGPMLNLVSNAKDGSATSASKGHL
jgi:hypothetical protein